MEDTCKFTAAMYLFMHYLDKMWVCRALTRMSRQAAFNRVIWSAIVSVVKPGSCLANSTVLMMHLVESSLNLSHRLTSRGTLWSELLFWSRTETMFAYSVTYLPIIPWRCHRWELHCLWLTVVYLPSWHREGKVSWWAFLTRSIICSVSGLKT